MKAAESSGKLPPSPGAGVASKSQQREAAESHLRHSANRSRWGGTALVHTTPASALARRPPSGCPRLFVQQRPQPSPVLTPVLLLKTQTNFMILQEV